MAAGRVEYRHPQQGWTCRMPVEDVMEAPEVWPLPEGGYLVRADLEDE